MLDLYVQRAINDENLFKLGRVGIKNLSSCEDSLIMRGAFALGLTNAYNPKMILYHHLDSKRFDFKYLIRLMYAYGVSRAVLEGMLNSPQPIPEHCSSRMKFLKMLFMEVLGGLTKIVSDGCRIRGGCTRRTKRIPSPMQS